MSTGRVWAVALICMVAGASVLLTLGERTDVSDWVARAAGTALVVLPAGLAANVTARRSRARRREDSPDSVEFQAAHAARSAAFGDGLVLAALTMLALTVAPGPQPMVWAVLLVVALVVAFWLRYAVALGRLRG